jgi:hypothetical protein
MPRSLSAEYYHVIRQLLTLSAALALTAVLVPAEVTHPDIPRHHAHAAESRSPHAAEKRYPHAAATHAKPRKPPKRTVAAHEKPPKAARH